MQATAIKEAPRQTEQSVMPQYLQIETVSVCNARCTMCLTRDCRRARPFMSDELFGRIADELQDHAEQIVRVTVQAAGEPLLDKKLENRIGLLKNNGIGMVAFASNGSLMSAERAHRVIDSGVDEVSFSVDGATKQTYEKIRVGLDFDLVVANIQGFLRLRQSMRAKTIVRIRMTAQEANQDELDAFVEFWQGRLGPGDSVYAKVVHTWGNAEQLTELPAEYDYEQLNRQACQSPWTSMVIFSDGQVPLCCCDYNASISLGNVNEQSIRQIWQADTLQKVRQSHRRQGRQALQICRDCTVWDEQARVETDG